MSIHIETSGLPPEQKLLFIQWAQADHDGRSEEAQEVKNLLLEQGIHPCYDAEDEVYTYIFG